MTCITKYFQGIDGIIMEHLYVFLAFMEILQRPRISPTSHTLRSIRNINLNHGFKHTLAQSTFAGRYFVCRRKDCTSEQKYNADHCATHQIVKTLNT